MKRSLRYGNSQVPGIFTDIPGISMISHLEVQLEVSRISLFVPANPNEFLRTMREGGGCLAGEATGELSQTICFS